MAKFQRNIRQILPRQRRAAVRHSGKVYLAEHNAGFARPPEIAESAFVTADRALLSEILCLEEERVVARDNTFASWPAVAAAGEPDASHYVRARVKGRHYPDGTLAGFHGPRRLARYDADGRLIEQAVKAAA